MKEARFSWFVLISILIHTALLSVWSLLPRHETRTLSPLEVSLLATLSPAPAEMASPAQEKLFSAPGKLFPTPERSSRADTSSAITPAASPDASSSPPAESSAPSFGGEARSSSAGEEASSGDGNSLGGQAAGGEGGIPFSSGGTAVGRGGTSAGRGGAPSGGSGKSSGEGRIPPRRGHISSGIASGELPSWFAGVDEGYDRYSLSIDSYSLQAGNIRRNVPGTDVCVDGDQLRTKEPLPITQIVTDNSKCYMIMKGGDREVRFCPPDSRSEALLYQGHLTAPLTHSVNACLAYDDSNCWITVKDDKERKVCRRHDFEYKGVWAVGTLTKYKCTKWETRTHSNSLQYTVRYMIPYRLNDRVTKLREVHRVTQSVDACDRTPAVEERPALPGQ